MPQYYRSDFFQNPGKELSFLLVLVTSAVQNPDFNLFRFKGKKTQYDPGVEITHRLYKSPGSVQKWRVNSEITEIIFFTKILSFAQKEQVWTKEQSFSANIINDPDSPSLLSPFCDIHQLPHWGTILLKTWFSILRIKRRKTSGCNNSSCFYWSTILSSTHVWASSVLGIFGRLSTLCPLACRARHKTAPNSAQALTPLFALESLQMTRGSAYCLQPRITQQTLSCPSGSPRLARGRAGAGQG